MGKLGTKLAMSEPTKSMVHTNSRSTLCWKRFSLLAPILAFALAQQAVANTSTPQEQAQHQQFVATDDFNKEDWYKRYPAYPPYCSIPSEMETRGIPALANDVRSGESRLVHATAIIRHGARTPYTGNLTCWHDYWESEETGKWDCDLKTLTSPPTPKEISEDEGEGNKGGTAMFLFEKHYDALLDSQDNLANTLNGTCEVGQLLLRGYDQEIVNGQHLRTAYLFDERTFSHDPRMRLIDISEQGTTYVWDASNIYYRVDDDQRTVMSGQVLLRGMMGDEIAQFFSSKKRYPIIPLHTADKNNDILAPNEHECPRLAEIRERFEKGNDYQTFDQSDEAVLLRSFVDNVLGAHGEVDAIDCLMTTICTDRTLPDAVNDYTGGGGGGGDRQRQLHNEDGDSSDESSDDAPPIESYGENLFQRLYDFDVKKYALNILARDGEYSQLGMGPMWAEIMTNINAFVDGKDTVCCPIRTPPKLALFSGHDTTLMPLLVSLGKKVWDGEWPAYASMVLIELHEVNIDGRTDKSLYKSDFAFRLLLNGKVLTHLLDDCPNDAELCDVLVLQARVAPFAKMQRECARQHGPAEVYTDTVSRAKEILSTTGGVVAFLLLVVSSAVTGAFATFFYLTGSMPARRRQNRVNTSAVESYQEGGLSLTGFSNGRRNGYSDAPSEDDDSYDLRLDSRAAESAALDATIT